MKLDVAVARIGTRLSKLKQLSNRISEVASAYGLDLDLLHQVG